MFFAILMCFCGQAGGKEHLILEILLWLLIAQSRFARRALQTKSEYLTLIRNPNRKWLALEPKIV